MTFGELIQPRNVAEGLIYIHNQGMIRGELKGVRFRVVGVFESHRIYSSRPTYRSTKLGPAASRTAVCSSSSLVPLRLVHIEWHVPVDEPGASCSVPIWVQEQLPDETISGSLPFHECSDLTAFIKVVEGEHPPRGVRLTQGLWEVGIMLGISAEQQTRH